MSVILVLIVRPKSESVRHYGMLFKTSVNRHGNYDDLVWRPTVVWQVQHETMNVVSACFAVGFKQKKQS